MKASLTSLLFILLLITFSCSKEDDCDNPVDCLPPATQTGANTAGCLVNGQVFLPAGQSLGSGSILQAQYVFHNDQYIFGLSIRDRTGTHNEMVAVETKMDQLFSGETYQLKSCSEHSNTGFYLIGGGLIDGYVTTEQITGELKITPLDEAKKIISGTFWFDAINDDNEIVQVREGRFDVHYY